MASAQDPAPFELSGYTPDEIFGINDELPLLKSDLNISRLIDRVSRSSYQTLQKFNNIAGASSSVLELNTNPRDYRCHVVSLVGDAKFATQANDDFYLLNAEDASGHSFLVCVARLPNHWPLDQTINEPIRITGFFLANFDLTKDADLQDQLVIPGNSEIVPLVVAKQVNWFPSNPNSEIKVKPTQQILAEHGVDIAAMDLVQPSGNLDDSDTNLFYQMLAACTQIESVPSPATKQFTECLRNPGDSIGDSLIMTGQLRRATRITVEDPFWAQVLGQDHYFQLDVFVPLDNQQIVIRNPGFNETDRDSADKIVHDNRYPIVVCVPELPKPADQMERSQIAISGFFLKLWNYESGYSQQNRSAPKQISPLVIAISPKIIVQPANPLNFWIGLAGIVTLLGTGFLLWFVRSDARKSTPSIASTKEQLPDQIEIPSID